MSTRCVSLSARDAALLRLLSWTPATTALLMRASVTFDGGPFLDDRRLRERLQSLAASGFVRAFPTAQLGGGLQNFYKLTPLGFDMIYAPDTERPSRAFFAEVSPSLFSHTVRLAEAIVETVRACHTRRVGIERFIRENQLTLVAGDREVQPDCFFRLATCGRTSNLCFEVDNSTASIDSYAVNSIRQKLLTYHAYQEHALAKWRSSENRTERPRFRVVFLTPTVTRAYHILALAADLTHRHRRLVYAAAFDNYVTEPDRLFAPIFLDHFGNWQALIDLHPTASFQKTAVRLTKPVESTLLVC